jgi:prepilin-type N-terminal cleavage/methylation domain-containing protein
MQGRTDTSRRAGFTLLEVMTVVILIGIMSATVIPSLAGVRDARAAAAAVEARRLIALAREHAMLSGEPSAAAIDPDDESIALQWIDSETGTIEPMPDALGAGRPAVRLDRSFAGAGIASFSDGAGTPGPGTVWFGFDGVPEVRNESGVLLGIASSDSVLAMDDGSTVTVRRGSGLIE